MKNVVIHTGIHNWRCAVILIANSILKNTRINPKVNFVFNTRSSSLEKRTGREKSFTHLSSATKDIKIKHLKQPNTKTDFFKSRIWPRSSVVAVLGRKKDACKLLCKICWLSFLDGNLYLNTVHIVLKACVRIKGMIFFVTPN